MGYSVDIALALILLTNLTSAMESLADYTFKHIQNLSNETVIGQAFANELYLKVRWAWLVFPIGVVLLVFGLFVTDKASAVWNSDSLAILFHGLHTTAHCLNLRRPRQMDKAAKKMRVKLPSTADGELKLVSTECTSWEEPVEECQGIPEAVQQVPHRLTPEMYSYTDLMERYRISRRSADEVPDSRHGTLIGTVVVQT